MSPRPSSSLRALLGRPLLGCVAGSLAAACSSSPVAQPVSTPKPEGSVAPVASATASAEAGPVKPPCVAESPPPPLPAPTGKRAIHLSMGLERACAVLEDGRVSCWGGPWRGHAVTVVPGIDDAVQVAVLGGARVAFVARKDGSLMRIGPDGSAAKVAGLSGIVEVAAGDAVVAVRGKDGAAQVAYVTPFTPAKVTFRKLPAKDVAHVSAGGHACALDAAEHVSCFTVGEKSIKPYSIPALGAVKAILSGSSAACATLASGVNRCFEVGRGASSYKPVDLPAGKLVGLTNHRGDIGPVACVDTPEGLACERLELGSGEDAPLIDKAPGGTSKPGTVQWVSSRQSACLRDQDGKVRCWGWRTHGILGQPDPEKVSWPAKVPGVEDVVSLRAALMHTCALRRDGKVLCWGASRDAKTFAVGPHPHVVAGLSDVVRLLDGADGREMCAVKKDGAVACFLKPVDGGPERVEDAPAVAGARQILEVIGAAGAGLITAQGALQTGSSAGLSSPKTPRIQWTPVAGVPAVRRLLGGENELIAITETEQAWTMSIDPEGKFGAPKRAPKLDGAKALVSSYAILWNDGTLTFGDPRREAVKHEKTPLVALFASPGPDGRRCGLTGEGAVVCRGEDGFRPLPGVPKAAAGDGQWNHACVIDSCAEVQCWGDNSFGEAGVSYVADTSELVTVDL